MNMDADQEMTDPRPEPDFELLERYLDRELTQDETLRLEQRLSSEPELAEALARMSADYAIRRAVWASMEPAPADAMNVAAGVGRFARKAELRRRLARLSRIAGAAAACVMLGFLAGWVGRGGSIAQANEGGTPTTRPAVHPSSHDGKAAQPTEPPGLYQVALTDEAGNITAVQKFATLEDARNFAADVGRWQALQAQIDNGQPVMTSSGL